MNSNNTYFKWFEQIKKTKPYYNLFFMLILSSFFLSVFSYLFPVYFSIIIDNLILRNNNVVYAVIIFMLCTSIFMIVLSFLKSYMQGWMHNRVLLSFRKKNFEHLMKLPVTFFMNFSAGKIAQRFFEDIECISGTVVGSTVSICVELTKIIMIFVILSVAGYKFLLIFMLMTVSYVLNMTIFKKPIENSSRMTGAKTGELYVKLYDIIPGIKEVKNFTTEKSESRIFVNENCSLFRLKMKNFVTGNVMLMIADAIPSLAMCASLFIAVGEYINGGLSLGFFVMVMSYMQMIKAPVESLVLVVTGLKQNLPAIERLEEISDAAAEDALMFLPAENIKVKEEFIPSVELKDVNFTYPGTNRQVLKNISINIEPGKSVAIVGHTGAGKSTVISLILKYYLPSSGSIFISGNNILHVKAAALRKNIAVVSQHPHIFFTTIEKNLTYGSKVSHEELTAVCKKIHLHDFIETLPEGYDSILGENGVKLSGGQKQLVAIGRAIIKNAPVLILDEATSALDSETESDIKDALGTLIKGRTTIAIAHRLSTIINSDEIIALENGEIREKGVHQELLELNGIYAKLYKEQFKSGYIKI